MSATKLIEGFATICSTHGKFLSAQPNGTAQCNRDKVDEWEQVSASFEKSNGKITVSLKSFHGKFLSAQPDGSLVWDREAANAWEKFTVNQLPVKGNMKNITLLSAHGKFVSAQEDGTIVADRSKAWGWEKFTMSLGEKKLFHFQVGLCPLGKWQAWAQIAEFYKSNPVPPEHLDVIGVQTPETPSHAALYLGNDVFEYDANGFHRKVGVGYEERLDWEKLGAKVQGTTYVRPDALEKKIADEGQWKEMWVPDTGYHLLNHNCHQFVKYCLDQIGAGFFYKGHTHRYLS